ENRRRVLNQWPICHLGLAQQNAAHERLASLVRQARFTLRPSAIGDGGRSKKVGGRLVRRQVAPPRPPGSPAVAFRNPLKRRHSPNVTCSERISYSSV